MNAPQKIQLPDYARFALILLGGVLLFYILSKAKMILIPVSFAFILSVLLQPCYRKMIWYKFPPALAAILCITLVLGFLAVIIFFMWLQISYIAEDLPQIGQRLNTMVDKAQGFLTSRFGINQEVQSNY